MTVKGLHFDPEKNADPEKIADPEINSRRGSG